TKQAEQAKKFEQGIQARDKVLEHLLDNTEIAVPESIVETEIHNHLEQEGRLEDDEHRAEVDESTRKALRTQFLLDEVGKVEEVEVGQPELVEYLMMQAQQYGMEPQQFAQLLDQQGQVKAWSARSPAARLSPPRSTRRRSSTPTATRSTSTRSSPRAS